MIEKTLEEENVELKEKLIVLLSQLQELTQKYNLMTEAFIYQLTDKLSKEETTHLKVKFSLN